MNWKIGQKLVSLCGGSWAGSYEPRKDEVVTFDGYDSDGDIYLIEYTSIPPEFNTQRRAAFYIKDFRPLLGDSAKSELISSFTEVTETSDCPIKQPQREEV